MVHKRVITRCLQLTVSILSLTQGPVITTHITQQTHIVLGSVDI